MTINKMMLSKKISAKLKCTNTLASQFINVFSDVILEEIASGNSVMLGSIGKLIIKEINPRKGVNPSTRENITIPGKLRLKICSYRLTRGTLHRRFKDIK